MMGPYFRGRGQHTQCHLGVGMDLCMIINQNQWYCSEERTLVMPMIVALKVTRGCRYVDVMVSNWPIAVFAYPIVLTTVSAGPAMGFILNTLSSAS